MFALHLLSTTDRYGLRVDPGKGLPSGRSLGVIGGPGLSKCEGWEAVPGLPRRGDRLGFRVGRTQHMAHVGGVGPCCQGGVCLSPPGPGRSPLYF